MARFIHFGSGQSGILPDGWGVLYIDEARRHAASIHPGTGEAIRLNSSADFIEQLDRLRDTARRSEDMRVQYLDVHSHGNAGLLAFGPSQARMEVFSDWGDCEGRGYESMFVPNAEMVFSGCAVADRGVGEYFLARAAWIFFRQSGGIVAGYRSWSLSIGSSFGDSSGVAHHLPPESWDRVEARIATGGHVVLHNARYLRPGRLRERVRAVRRELDQYRRRPTMRALAGAGVDDASRDVEQAERQLIGEHHRYSALYAADWYISRTERSLRDARVPGRYDGVGVD